MLFWNFVDGLTLIALGACVFVWPTQLISDRANRWLRIVAIVLVIAQVATDGPRVQLAPAYFVALLFALLLVVDRARPNETSKDRESREGPRKKFARWALVLTTGGAVLASAVLLFAMQR